jgi:hypothetical protein
MKSYLAFLLFALTAIASTQNPTFRALNKPSSAPPAGDALFIQTQTVGTPRSDFTGCVGLAFTTPGSSPPTITALCRARIAGNNQTHSVDLTQAGAGVLETVSIDMSSTSGDVVIDGVTYACIDLGSPHVTDPSVQYFVLSHETNGGDEWYDNDFSVDTVTSAFGTHDGSALESGGCGAGTYNNNVGAPASYVATNFKAH